ncbi:MAG: ATP-binding cassette domain-containing protein [Bacteroidota bacterium]
MNHIAIYTSNSIDKRALFEAIISNDMLNGHVSCKGRATAVFSGLIINNIIEHEYKHDVFPIQTAENKSLESMSSGQQKIALARYLFEQNPDYMILDDIQSSIDAHTLAHLMQMIAEQASSTQYVQICYRKEDVLPFVETVLCVDESMQITNTYSLQEFQSQFVQTSLPHAIKIPQLFDDVPFFDPLIDLRFVSLSYEQKPVLNSISWKIRPGEFWELRGPIGSGKSSLLSMIIGDNPKAYGQDMVLFGRKKGSGESIWDIKKNSGYFYPKMVQLFERQNSVQEMIISGFFDSIGLYVRPTKLQYRIANDWLHVLDDSFRTKGFQQLSPGQQRIVLVIRALVKHPPLLILDEPTAGLDDENARVFVDLISVVASYKKMAIIYVSHRHEKGLQPDFVFELVPQKNGSVGKMYKK